MGCGRCAVDRDRAAGAVARRPTPRPACRTRTRSKGTSRTSRGSTSPTAPASLVHPAPWYIGIKQLPLFGDQKRRPEDRARRGRARRRAGAGRDDRRHADADPVDQRAPRRRQRLLHVGHRAQGSAGRVVAPDERVHAGAADAPIFRPAATSSSRRAPTPGRGASPSRANRSTRSARGYTAWQRYDHNRIDLVPERKTYKPGDTARIMIQSPWEQATALVTTEREGIRTHRQFALTSTQQSIDVPIAEDDIPNIYVSVLLVKGRTQAARRSRRRKTTPAIPASRRSGSATSQLAVEDATQAADRRGRGEQGRVPAGEHRDGHARREGSAGARHRQRSDAVGGGLRRAVADRASARPTCSARSTSKKALQVLTEDTRQKIICRRVLTPKGDTDGGGGGVDAGRQFRAQGLPRARVLDRIGHDRRARARRRRRQAAGVADDLPDHGGRRRQGLALRIRRQRDPHQQAGDAEGRPSRASSPSATRRRSARSSPAS